MYFRLLYSVLFIVLSVFSLSAQEGLKILSYNIHHANPPSEDSEVIDLPAIAKVINDSDADLVGLQEVDINVTRSGNIDQAKELARLTNRYYYFAKGIDLQGGEYGVAILSKFPFIKQENYLLPMPINGEQRVVAFATVLLNSGQEVIFGTTHLDLHDENRSAQAEFIVNFARENNTRPIILTGDLNAEPDSQPIKTLDSKFVRSQIANGFTFPQINPRTEIDYIMVANSKSLQLKNHKVINEEYASDHCPLYVEISLD